MTQEIKRKRRPAGSRRQPQQGTPMGAFEDAKSEIESLRDEMQEWQGSLEGNSMEHLPKYDEVTEAVDTLDNVMSEIEDAEGEDWPEGLDEIVVHWTIDTRRSATSRSSRMGNALNALNAAAEGLRQWVESKKEEPEGDGEAEGDEDLEGQIDTAENIADRLESASSEAEGVNFPGMY